MKIYIRYRISRVKLISEYLYKYIKRVTSLKKKRLLRYPLTIQLPITYKCNFNCIMCGMQKLNYKKDFTPEELKKILQNKLFKNIENIGLNGGEPFLRKDLISCVNVIQNTLPNLKCINIISNGYFTDLIKDKLAEIYEKAKKDGIKVNISFSVDGIDEMQNYMRGHKNAWVNVIKTINEINNNRKKYCDSIEIICTVTKYNVFNLNEVEVWAKQVGIYVRYNIATINERIANADRFNNFSIFTDEKARMVAKEFFYKKAIQERSETYFGIFLYICSRKRYANCPCQYNEWITLNPNGNISFCATYSKELGNALIHSAYDIMNGNTEVLSKIIKNNCLHCSHYIGQLDLMGLRLFYKELLKNNLIMF